MNTAIITTTINRPNNLLQWSRTLGPDDHIIVAGDLKTPHAEVRDVLNLITERQGTQTQYVDPGFDNSGLYLTHKVTGYNVIQRRNVALLRAIETEADVIVTVDDDNYPGVESWVPQVSDALYGECRITRTATNTGWWNPGNLCTPRVTHRGFPITQRHQIHRATHFDPTTRTRLGVFASLWLGDPDIDAMERIVTNPEVRSVTGNAVLDAGTWAPFNSQATAFRRELAPLMHMWLGVGRFDDIWASYAARAVMDALGWHVRYGHPVVTQARNPHDLVRDLDAEVFGHRHNDKVISILRRASESLSDKMSPLEALRRVYAQLCSDATFLPAETLRGFSAWTYDLEKMGLE